MNYKRLMECATTDRQREVLEVLDATKSQHATARQLGMSQKSVWRIVEACKKRYDTSNVAPRKSESPSPQAFSVKGYSTLRKYETPEGEKVMEWVKTDRNADAQAQAMRAAIEAFRDELPRALPVPASASSRIRGGAPLLLNQYLITDYHLGMLAWGEETGDADWDTGKAEDLLVRWFQAAVDQAPAADKAIFAQLGDFLHWDGFEAVTPTSGHVLDADTRFQRLVRVTIRVIRRVMDILLAKYSAVHVIMADANHDPASGAWLREFLAAFYETDPRVTVETSARTYYAYQHGRTLLCYHHGHKRPPKRVDEVFVANFRREYGQTDHAYGHLGHLHNDQVIETPLMKIEQHRTLAPNDAYASRGGWMSGRDAKVITYHKHFGEVSRLTISPAAVLGIEDILTTE